MSIPSYPSLFYILATIIHSLTRIGLIPAPPAESKFRKLLFGAFWLPAGAPGFHPALLSRLAQAARGRFARLDSPLCEFRFHWFSRRLRMAARQPACLGVWSP